MQTDDDNREIHKFYREVLKVMTLSRRELQGNNREFKKLCQERPQFIEHDLDLLLNGAMGKGAWLKAWEMIERNEPPELCLMLLRVIASLNHAATLPKLNKRDTAALFQIMEREIAYWKAQREEVGK